MEFNVIDDNNEFKLGNVLTVFEIPESNRKFILFSVSAFDREDNTLNIAYLNRDKEGYDYIEEIDDDNIYKKAMLVVKDIMEVINEK